MSKLNQKVRDIAAIHDTIQNTGHLRIHLTYSRGGTVTARIWHPDGFKVGSAGGGGYDKQGAALGEAIQILFPEEIKTLPLPVRRSNGSIESGLYGISETKDGKRYLDGACGRECMIQILKALGFRKVEIYATSKDSSLLIADKE